MDESTFWECKYGGFSYRSLSFKRGIDFVGRWVFWDIVRALIRFHVKHTETIHEDLHTRVTSLELALQGQLQVVCRRERNKLVNILGGVGMATAKFVIVNKNEVDFVPGKLVEMHRVTGLVLLRKY